MKAIPGGNYTQRINSLCSTTTNTQMTARISLPIPKHSSILLILDGRGISGKRQPRRPRLARRSLGSTLHLTISSGWATVTAQDRTVVRKRNILGTTAADGITSRATCVTVLLPLIHKSTPTRRKLSASLTRKSKDPRGCSPRITPWSWLPVRIFIEKRTSFSIPLLGSRSFQSFWWLPR